MTTETSVLESGEVTHLTGNVSIMFLDDSVDPTMVYSKYPELTEIQIIDSKYKGNEIVDLYLKMDPDVVFVDLKKLRNDGIYAVGKIRQIDPNAKIIYAAN